MTHLDSFDDLARVPGPVCVAIGVFDGVHRGHQVLIQRVMDEAAALGGSAVVLTFHPHPMRVVRPDAAPRLLTSTPHKIRLIEALGCPHLLLLPIYTAFAAQEAAVFVEKLVRHAHPLRRICVGHQWAFGRGRSGNVDLLRRLGRERGF